MVIFVFVFKDLESCMLYKTCIDQIFTINLISNVSKT